MPLSTIEESLILAAYFRGGSQDDLVWSANGDQILTLSLFYTGDITEADCVLRFSRKSYVQKLYDESRSSSDELYLTQEIEHRYEVLIKLLQDHLEFIEGGGDYKTPALPTFMGCRLTEKGMKLAMVLVKQFPQKPEFPNWPDKRTMSKAV